MRLRTHALFALLMMLIVFLVSPVSAITRSDVAKQNLTKQAEVVSSMNKAKATLQSKPSDEWSTEEVQTYLYFAVWDVFLGANAYVNENRVAAKDASSLIDGGYVSEWPDNPFNNWQPMVLHTSSTEFSPGDLCLLTCPYEFYSGYQTLVPRCFEICVFGPSIEFAEEYGDAEINQQNTWAYVPRGAVCQMGYYTTTHKQLMEVLAERESDNTSADE